MAEPLKQSKVTPAFGRENDMAPVTFINESGSMRRKADYQAYQVLHFAFTVAPILAGFDKYFNFMTSWESYLAPIVPRMTGVMPHNFMQGVGLVEIVAGIGVALKPRIFAYIVSVWMIGTLINLMLIGMYDLALRDFGLSMGALALARLSSFFDRGFEQRYNES